MTIMIAHLLTDAAAFAGALKLGADRAYKAVMKPREGTILTVARAVADSAVNLSYKDTSKESLKQL